MIKDRFLKVDFPISQKYHTAIDFCFDAKYLAPTHVKSQKELNGMQLFLYFVNCRQDVKEFCIKLYQSINGRRKQLT